MIRTCFRATEIVATSGNSVPDNDIDFDQPGIAKPLMIARKKNIQSSYGPHCLGLWQNTMPTIGALVG
jgi:hypothetical protein